MQQSTLDVSKSYVIPSSPLRTSVTSSDHVRSSTSGAPIPANNDISILAPSPAVPRKKHLLATTVIPTKESLLERQDVIGKRGRGGEGEGERETETDRQRQTETDRDRDRDFFLLFFILFLAFPR